MADDIRDVLIRVGITKTGEVEPPDVRAAQQRLEQLSATADSLVTNIKGSATEQLAAVNKALADLQSQAKATFESLSKTSLDHMAGDPEAVARAEALAVVMAEHVPIVEQLQEKQEELNQAIKDEEKAHKIAEKATRERESSLRQMEGVQRQLREEQNQLFDGVMRLARAAAILANNEEDAAKYVKRIADFQMAVDVVKGLRQAYDSLTDIVRLSARAKDLEAIANARLAASNTTLAASTQAVTAASTSASAGVGGLLSILSPVNLVAAAAAGGLYFLSTAMRQVREDTAKAEEQLRKMTSIEEFQRLIKLGLNDEGGTSLRAGRSRITSQAADADIASRQGQDKVAAIEAEQARTRAESNKLQEAYRVQVDALKRLREIQSSVPDYASAQQGMGMADQSFWNQMSFGALFGSATSHLAWGGFQAYMSPTMNTSNLPGTDSEADAIKNSLPLVEEAVRNRERELSLIEASKKERDDILKSEQKTLEVQEKSLKTEAERLEKERERAQELQSQLGRLSQEDIAAARRTAEKVRQGKDLSLEDIQAGDRVAGGQRSAALEQAALRRYEQLGVSEIRNLLGFDSPQDILARNAEQQAAVGEAMTELGRALEENREKQVELHTAAAEALREVNAELTKLREQMQEMKEYVSKHG